MTDPGNPDAAVVSIAIQPQSAVVLVGDSLQLNASVVMSNSRPPKAVSWTSSNTSLASVNAAGLVHGLAAGSLFIHATSAGKDDSAGVTIAAPSPLPVASVSVAPASLTVTVGGTATLVATLKDSNGNTLAGRSITWTSNNPSVATVGATGLVTAASVGSATITATSEGQSGSTSVTVTTVPVASLAVSPASASVQAGQTVQLSATPKDASGNALSGRTVTWSSSNVGVATVNTSGLVSGIVAGSATVTATSEGQSGSVTVTVTAVPVASVVVSPASASVQAGQTAQLSAALKDANGNSLSGRTVTWSSSNTAVATVNGSGLVSGVAAGSATITATSEGQSGTSAITVTAVALPGTVSDLAASGPTDSSVTLSFTEVGDGTGQPASYDVRYVPGSSLSWSGSVPSVTRGTCATPLAGTAIGAKRSCTVLGLAAGTTYTFQLVAYRGTLNVNAVFGALSNTAMGSTAVSTAPVASVTLSPSPASVQVSGTLQLTATLKDASGNLLSGRTVTWSSSNSSMASVSATGLVSGVAAGSATITATSEGQNGTVPLSVTTSQPGQVTYYRTNFSDGTTGPLDVYGSGSGTCTASSDYHDPGSAYSIKCTAVGTQAAALQAWFGNGRLANQPNDPSLDQDLFEEVRWVLAPGAAAAIGGTSCNGSNPNSQFKVHKSVYGQAGSAWNGWAMAEIAPCSDGNIGLFSEAEMWNLDGREYPWPGTYPGLHEGTVYDVVYRYHRYTAQGCGTMAIWVNGAKVMDTPCLSYMGTTNGSGQGLLFWDGMAYLQNGLAPLTVYTLFAQATNYPVGAGTASP